MPCLKRVRYDVFVQRAEDGRFVMDRSHEHQRDQGGLVHVTLSESHPYCSDEKSYATMMELLMSVGAYIYLVALKLFWI